MQHHLIKLLFKDGVYEASETIEALSHPEKPRSGAVGNLGSRYIRSAAPMASRLAAFTVCWCLAEGFLQQLAVGLVYP
jgi:hypothetical protein